MWELKGRAVIGSGPFFLLTPFVRRLLDAYLFIDLSGRSCHHWIMAEPITTCFLLWLAMAPAEGLQAARMAIINGNSTLSYDQAIALQDEIRDRG